jgi:hypothetical protein
LAKVNYQYEKRQRELNKKRKQEQKAKLKQNRKDTQPEQAPVIVQPEKKVETPAEAPVENQDR